MSNAKLKDFTPVPDEIVKEHGLLVGAVWGRMWRYAQQKDGICRASEQRIADDLNLGRMTVRRAKEKLVESDYIKDTTPGVRNAPHIYTINRYTTLVQQTEIGVPERDSGYTTVVQQNSESSTTVVYEDTIEDTKKRISLSAGEEETELPRETDPPKNQGPTKKELQYAMMCAVGEVCKMDIKLNDGRVGKCAKGLLAAGYTIEQLQRYYGPDSWWYKNDWRGKQNSPPKPEQINETIKQAVESNKHSGPTFNGGRIPSA